MRYAYVQSPSTFPIERRRIYLYPIADVTYKQKEAAFPLLAEALDVIAKRYPDQRILVHTVSYELAAYLAGTITARQRILVYTNSSERQRTLDIYRYTPGAILLASSFERGIDLPGEDCRAIVVCKIPYPTLGDKQINARLHSRGGQLWYSVQTARSLVQMTGRGMRSVNDWCDSFILDRQFVNNVWKKNKNLLPAWWKEALVWDAGRLT